MLANKRETGHSSLKWKSLSQRRKKDFRFWSRYWWRIWHDDHTQKKLQVDKNSLLIKDWCKVPIWLPEIQKTWLENCIQRCGDHKEFREAVADSLNSHVKILFFKSPQMQKNLWWYSFDRFNQQNQPRKFSSSGLLWERWSWVQ